MSDITWCDMKSMHGKWNKGMIQPNAANDTDWEAWAELSLESLLAGASS